MAPKIMKLISKSMPLVLISALGSTKSLLAFKTGGSSGGEMFPMALFAMTIYLGLLALTYATLLLPTTVIEWYFFKNQNIFKDLLHTYKLNILSLLWSVLYFAIFIFAAMVTSAATSVSFNSLMGLYIPIAFSLFFAMIFLLMKLLRVNTITKSNRLKFQLTLFNLINSALFGSILYLALKNSAWGKP